MKKIMQVFILLTIGAFAFDNSIDRWESDCLLKHKALGKRYNGYECSVAASQYLDGRWRDDRTGKYVKIKDDKKTRRAKAKALFSISCKATGYKSVCAFVTKGSDKYIKETPYRYR